MITVEPITLNLKSVNLSDEQFYQLCHNNDDWRIEQTAAGELIRADATQNQDLYWAARGAGPGFFGVVTCFHLQTRHLPKFLTAQFIKRLTSVVKMLQ